MYFNLTPSPSPLLNKKILPAFKTGAPYGRVFIWRESNKINKKEDF